MISLAVGLPQGWTSVEPHAVKDEMTIYPWSSTDSEARLDTQSMMPIGTQHATGTFPSPYPQPLQRMLGVRAGVEAAWV